MPPIGFIVVEMHSGMYFSGLLKEIKFLCSYFMVLMRESRYTVETLTPKVIICLKSAYLCKSPLFESLSLLDRDI